MLLLPVVKRALRARTSCCTSLLQPASRVNLPLRVPLQLLDVSPEGVIVVESRLDGGDAAGGGILVNNRRVTWQQRQEAVKLFVIERIERRLIAQKLL